MKKNQQYYVLKLNTSYLKKHKYKIDVLFNEAVALNQIVAVGDSAVLREIRRLTNHNVDTQQINDWFDLRRKIKGRQKSKENAKQIAELTQKINDALYIPEYVSIFVENVSHYEYINQHSLIINGKEFVRLLCSSGGARHNTVIFIDKDIYEPVDKFITNGSHDFELSPAKYNAYYALCSSASLPVSWLNFCVVPDCVLTRKTKVEFVHESEDNGIDDSVVEEYIDCEFNLWDGMGIISPEGAKKWAEDLELDYLPSAFCLRNSFLKGMVCVFDIQKFLKEKSNTTIVHDVWGNEVDLSKVDMILTESQLKLWKAYSSIQEYIKLCHENGYTFSITKVTPKYDRDYAYLNYQFIQATHQTQDSIEKLCEDTIEYFKKLIYEDNDYLRIYCLGKSTENPNITKEFFYSLQNQAKAVLLSDKFIDDPYVRNWLIQSLNKKIKESYIGNILVNGNFQVAISDPYALMEYVCGLEPKGLLQEHEIFCDYWIKRNVDKVAAMRAPLTWRSEVNVVNIKQDENTDYWYSYLYSGLVYNIYGVDCMLQADSDFDFDILLTTNNKQMIDGSFGGLPITYDKHPIKKVKIDKKELYKFDKRAFDTRIGFITNISTSLYTMLNNFKKDSKEYKKIIERLKILRKCQGNEIDKTKGANPKPFPIWWTRKTPDIIFKTEEEETLNKNIMVTKRPYFMRYLYSDYNKKYQKHVENFNVYCVSKYGYDINELKNCKYQTEATLKSLNDFEFLSPLIDNDSTMNLLCHYMEEKIQEIKICRKNKFNDYELMMSHKNKQSELLKYMDSILPYYNRFLQIRAKDIIEQEETDYAVYGIDINSLKTSMFNNISSNEEELCDICILLVYSFHPNYKKDFAWDLFGDIIIKNIINNTDGIAHMPVKDNNGTVEYLYSKYGFIELDLKEPLEE